jgi:hypothetical protein
LLRLTDALYEKGFSSKAIVSLYSLLGWLMMLPDDLTNRFTQNLSAYEKEKNNKSISLT